MASYAIDGDSGTGDVLWLRLPPQRSVVAAHVRHVRGRFVAAGWRVVEGLDRPTEVGGALAVMDDPMVEPLPAVASCLAGAEAAGCWRVPRINDVEPPQGWSLANGPYTPRDYERQALDRHSSGATIAAGPSPWTGFAVAAAGEAETLLNATWPPPPSSVRLVPAVRLYRYADPAAHPRVELDPFIAETTQILVDVGCGHGLLGTRHRRPGRRVIGIEPDRHLAAIAAGCLDLVLPCGAEEGLAALRPGIDCIVFADVLEHLVDPVAALIAAERVLAADGRIIVSLPNSAWAPVLFALAAGRWDPTLAGVQARDHLAPMTPASFRRLVSECGLKVIRETPLIAPLSRRLRVWAWLMARLSGGDWRDLLTPQWIAVLETTSERCETSDGPDQ